MKNPKPEIRSSNQIQRPKFQMGLKVRGSVLECGGWPPLLRCMSHSAAKAVHSTRGALLCASLLLALSGPMAASAQYALDWWTLDGGGGSSTGGVYTVTGTIAQPDAGPPAYAGSYALVGGFWSLVAAIQTPGAPYLSVFRTTTNTVVVSWPLPGSAGWVLQATNALPSLPGPWPLVAPPYRTNGPCVQVVEPFPVGHRFYRLHKP